ncbi:MAG: hypothetical protein KDK90_11970 [Leptospiraceae bacterium]|nr:hypothetical protein [Leptospiraceae bacterium]
MFTIKPDTKKGIRNFRLDSIFNLKITDLPIDETSKPDVAKHISEFHHYKLTLDNKISR